MFLLMGSGRQRTLRVCEPQRHYLPPNRRTKGLREGGVEINVPTEARGGVCFKIKALCARIQYEWSGHRVVLSKPIVRLLFGRAARQDSLSDCQCRAARIRRQRTSRLKWYLGTDLDLSLEA